MKTQTKEQNVLIARRQAPGDRWSLVDDSSNKIYKTLTDTLEAFMTKTGFKGEYRLAPLKSELYAITTTEEVVKPEPIKKFSIYGEVGESQE